MFKVCQNHNFRFLPGSILSAKHLCMCVGWPELQLYNEYSRQCFPWKRNLIFQNIDIKNSFHLVILLDSRDLILASIPHPPHVFLNLGAMLQILLGSQLVVKNLGKWCCQQRWKQQVIMHYEPETLMLLLTLNLYKSFPCSDMEFLGGK